MKLDVEGFQSHESSSLDFRGHLVCVTGPNNVGKSALAIRAVRWLLYDALRGSKFIRKGHDAAKVTVTDGGRVVVREKSRKTADGNRYVVDGKSYDSIGTGAPPEVEDALGIRRARIDKDLELELNVVLQKEHPFLMEETGTAKAKILNALTGAHVLDIAIRQTVTVLRSLRSQEKELGGQQVTLLGEVNAFADLLAKEEVVAMARKATEDLMARVERVRAARQALSDLARGREAVRALRSRPQADTAPIDALLSRLETLVPKVSSGRSDLLGLNSARTTRAALLSSKLNGADMASLDLLLALREGLEARRQDYAQAISNRKVARFQVEQMDGVQRPLDAAIADLKALAGNPCDECGRPLTEECLVGAA